MTRRERSDGLQLISAVQQADIEQVSALLDAGVNPSLVISKSTALLTAVNSKEFEIALLLVNRGADVHFAPGDGRNALSRAISNSWDWLRDEYQRNAVAELIPLLLAKGAKPSPSNLVTAAARAKMEMFRSLLATGVGNDEYKPSEDRPAIRTLDAMLAAAVAGNREEFVTELLQLGANPETEATTIHGEGPCINTAVFHQHKPIVQALLAAKPNLNRRATFLIGSFRSGRPKRGEHSGKTLFYAPARARNPTPLIVAVRCKDLDMIQLLVEAGADLDATDADGLSALAWAVRVKFKEAEELLRSRGASDAELEGSPLYSLYFGAAFGDVEKIRKALSRGADVNGLVEQRSSMYTPLIRASRAGRPAIVQMLLDAGADPNLGGRETLLFCSLTPLIMAARQGNKEVVELLLRAGAKTNSAIETPLHRGKGWDALQCAKDGHYWEIVELIEAASKAQAVNK